MKLRKQINCINQNSYLEINLTNKAQDSYTENYKKALKENKKDPKN